MDDTFNAMATRGTESLSLQGHCNVFVDGMKEVLDEQVCLTSPEVASCISNRRSCQMVTNFLTDVHFRSVLALPSNDFTVFLTGHHQAQ